LTKKLEELISGVWLKSSKKLKSAELISGFSSGIAYLCQNLESKVDISVCENPLMPGLLWCFLI